VDREHEHDQQASTPILWLELLGLFDALARQLCAIEEPRRLQPVLGILRLLSVQSLVLFTCQQRAGRGGVTAKAVLRCWRQMTCMAAPRPLILENPCATELSTWRLMLNLFIGRFTGVSRQEPTTATKVKLQSLGHGQHHWLADRSGLWEPSMNDHQAALHVPSSCSSSPFASASPSKARLNHRGHDGPAHSGREWPEGPAKIRNMFQNFRRPISSLFTSRRRRFIERIVPYTYSRLP